MMIPNYCNEIEDSKRIQLTEIGLLQIDEILVTKCDPQAWLLEQEGEVRQAIKWNVTEQKLFSDLNYLLRHMNLIDSLQV